MTRLYSSISVETTLASSLDNSAELMVVASDTASALLGGVTLGLDDVDQFTVAVDPDTSNEEIIFITGNSGDTFTIVRGQAGSAPTTHSGGATVRHVVTSNDFNYFNTAIQPSIANAKGDLIVASANDTVGRLGVGTNGQYLMANSADAKGMIWSNPRQLPVYPASGGLILWFDGTDPYWDETPGQNWILVNQTGTSYTISDLQFSGPKYLLTFNNSNPVTVSLPTYPYTTHTGGTLDIIQLGTGQVTIAFAGTGNSVYSASGFKLRTQYSRATLTNIGGVNYILSGDLTV